MRGLRGNNRTAMIVLDRRRERSAQFGNAQVVARHDLLCQVEVEAVELPRTGCERGHHVTTGALLLLPSM